MNRRSLSAESLNSPKIPIQTHNHSSSITRVYDRWTIICLLIALLDILHGLWMLVAPKHWYYNLPAGVPEYGPLNVHFIRDIGCTFFLLGIGLVFASFYLSYRLPLFTMNTGFYLLHMFVHIHEVVSGRIRLSMFWVDLPGVYIPAIVVFILNIFMITKYRTEENVRSIRK